VIKGALSWHISLAVSCWQWTTECPAYRFPFDVLHRIEEAAFHRLLEWPRKCEFEWIDGGFRSECLWPAFAFAFRFE